MSSKKAASKENILLALLLLLLTMLVAGLAVRAFRSSPALNRLLILVGLREERAVSESVSFDVGTAEGFAVAGENIAVVSATGAQLLDNAGETLARASFAMEKPAVSASPVNTAFFDAGGSSLYIISTDGSYTDLSLTEALYSVDVSRDGYVTLCSECPDYLGRVTVFSPELSPLFQFDCGQSGYPLCARVSPEGVLVLCCVSRAGTVLRWYNLDSTEELASYSIENRLFFDFDFLQDGTLAAISEDGLLFFDGSGTFLSELSFGGSYLGDYCLSGRNVLVLLRDNRSGTAGAIFSVCSDGSTVGELRIDRGVTSLSACESSVLVLYSDELTLYSDELVEDVSYQHVENVRRAMLREDGSALLFNSYGANIIHFN